MSAGAFFTEPRVETIRGEQIEIRPFPVKHLAAAATIAAPLIKIIGPGVRDIDMLALLAETDAIIALTALAIGRDKAWVGELDADELLRLAAVVIEENVDFFIRRLSPVANQIADRLAKLSKTPGP